MRLNRELADFLVQLGARADDAVKARSVILVTAEDVEQLLEAAGRLIMYARVEERKTLLQAEAEAFPRCTALDDDGQDA